MAEDQEDIYEQHVMRHFEEPYHRGTTARATHRHRMDNPLCGDSVQIELVITERGRIHEAWFEAAGCCTSQAAASMITEHLEGKLVADAQAFSARDMLKLFGAPLTAQRQQCCLLSWKAWQVVVHSPVR